MKDSPVDWKGNEEKGTTLGMRIVLFCATRMGRRAARVLLRGIALYYTLFARESRRHTRHFLAAVGEPTHWRRVYRQFFRFAQCALDALFLIQGRKELFQVSRHGSEHLQSLKARGQGALLLGAHLGSFYAMRMQSAKARVPIYPVMYTEHARRYNAILRELSPESALTVVEMGQGMDFMLRIRELIEAGKFVAILGDRVGAKERRVEVEFLGRKAALPAGPYILGAMLKCPVLLTLGIYREPNHYALHCEPFATRIELPRKKRDEALHSYAQRYADRLGHFTRLAPDNWFNFFEFWSSPTDG